MTDRLQYDKLLLLHEVSDLVAKNGLWLEIARLGMTREFIDLHTNLYARIIMELDYIEKHAPQSGKDAKKLKTIAAQLSRQEVNT